MADIAQTFAADPYSAQQAQLNRQQKLAEILQQQAFQPDQKFSYAGIEASPSGAGALAKGLQSGISGYLQGRSLKGQDDLIKKASDDTTSSTAALIKGLSEKPWIDPDTGKASGTAGGYQGAIASLGDMPDNPQAQKLAQALTMKKLEQDMAQTKLGPGEAVFNSSGAKLFGQDPAAKFGTSPQNIARDQNSPTGWSGTIVDATTGNPKSIPVQPPQNMTDLTMDQRATLGLRGAEVGQAGQKLNFDTGLTPAMPPSVAGAPAPQMPPQPGMVPPASAPSPGAVPTPPITQATLSPPGAPGARPMPATATADNPVIKNVPPAQQQKLFAEQPGAKQAVTTILSTADQHTKMIDNLLDQKGFNDIFGTINSKTPNISERAGNAQASFDAVANQAAMQALSDMRAASKTGGAVGQVTEKEYPILQSQFAALAQSQGPAQMRENLAKIKQTYARIKQVASDAYSSTYGESVASGGGNAIDDLLTKYGAK